ncbi:MAG: trehalose-phosphatase [Candidatus Nanopelagicales bacterium]
MTAGLPGDAGLAAALAALAGAPRLLVCCDFDGTLSTLADHPMAARPVDGAVAALDALAGLPDTWAAVISGRALIDLTQLAQMPGRVHLVGSHGNEFEVGRILAVSPAEDGLLEALASRCRAITDGVAGAFVEAKPGSVAVHVRMAKRADAERVLAAARRAAGSLPGVHVIEGKDLVELAVFPGAKGDAIHALKERWDVTGVLFVGDDLTDESGFAALGDGDVGVKVGGGSSQAMWRLPDPAAVVDLLARLALARSLPAR